MVNEQAQVTDDYGSIAVEMDPERYYAISSGNTAVTFTSLYDKGSNFIAQGDRVIEAERLVSAGPACRLLKGVNWNIYFETSNTSDVVHTIPPISKANRIYSVTGAAVPPENFAPGITGFTVPDIEFAQNGRLTGVWYFLGQTIVVDDTTPACSDRGSGQCSTISQQQLRAPIDYTRTKVVEITKITRELIAKGMWKGVKGSYVKIFLGRGASAIAAMQQLLAPTRKGTAYVCSSQPAASCTRVSLAGFKNVALRKFTSLYASPVPKSVSKRAAQEGRLFKTNVLDKLPNEIWICPSGVTPSN